MGESQISGETRDGTELNFSPVTPSNSKSPSGSSKTPTFYFDDGCSFCVKSAGRLERLGGGSIQLEPLGLAPPISGAGTEIDKQGFERDDGKAAISELSSEQSFQEQENFETARYRDSNGDIFSGHLAIASALRESPRRLTRWAGTVMKILGPISKAIYKVVARHRHQIKATGFKHQCQSTD